MRTICIDCSGVGSAAEFWQRYVDSVGPADAALFGRNLDALWDAVEGGGPGWPGEAELVFVNSSDLAPLRLANGDSLLEGLRRLAGEATRTRISLS